MFLQQKQMLPVQVDPDTYLTVFGSNMGVGVIKFTPSSPDSSESVLLKREGISVFDFGESQLGLPDYQ